jgi:hypothetical protein
MAGRIWTARWISIIDERILDFGFRVLEKQSCEGVERCQ